MESVTWDPAFFSAKNLTIRLLADYLNDTGAGQVAYISTPVSVSDGWIIWSIQKEWLQGMDSNNVTLYLDRIDSPNGAHRSFEGVFGHLSLLLDGMQHFLLYFNSLRLHS